MSQPTAPLRPSADQALEQLLDEIVGRLQAGEPADVERVTSLHPEYADQIQQLLPAMQALAFVGREEACTLDSAAGNGFAPPAAGVLGDFRIVRELGRGGMGVVYEAEQLSIGRRVALKVLPFASMLDERRLSRFRNEVRAAGQLHHSNIVPVYAVGCERGVHFYAMQLVAGHSLAQIISMMNSERPTSTKHSGETPPSFVRTESDTVNVALSTLRSSSGTAAFRTIARLMVQAADALEHAHASGVIHRDIKPSNLLLDERGSLWLTDFGLASVESGADLTMSGDLLGTLRYMSPEQTLGSRVVVDHRTDIYSLGATLYELAVLKPAFDADDRGELLRQIAVVEPKPPRRINGSLPPDLETIILKAMSKDVAGRYGTAQAMGDDLRRFLENKPILARRPSFAQRCRKWVSRHAAVTAVAVTALVLIAAVAAAAAVVANRSYLAEARSRAAADANLAVASKLIDSVLSRTADHRYWQGDLKQAEHFAAQATEFYEDLLQHSDEPGLRFRTAKAYDGVAHIWELLGRHEKAGVANRRAGALLSRLTTSHPGRLEYHAALAENYNRRGLIDWSLDRPAAAEPSWRQAWEIWSELADRHPDDLKYQSGLAVILANLGSVCYFTDRFDEAEEYYRRAEGIEKRLPAELRNSATGLASQAGSCTNQAELARLRGQYDRALELLEQSIALHNESLAQWPTNPVALDCYYHTRWNIIECHLGAKRAEEAAAAVEKLVETFPDRLQAYHEGAVQLLRCAALAEDPPVEATPAPSLGLGRREAGEKRATYRQRAQDLLAQAHNAQQRSPDALVRFACFLLTSSDSSLRDPAQALVLAKSAVAQAPERPSAHFMLALAHYRHGDWSEAEQAVRRSMKLHTRGGVEAHDSLLLAMTLWRQGQLDAARELYDNGAAVLSVQPSEDRTLCGLQAEAADLIGAAAPRD